MTCFTAKRGAAMAGLAAMLLTAWAGDAAGQPEPKGKKKGGESKTVLGRVKKMTEAPKGEIDGAELSDGTVIHWPPHLSKKFTAVAKKGDAVEATGRVETTPDGDKVFEVRTLTNLKTEETAENDGPPPPKDKKDKGKKGKDKKDDD